MYCCTVPQVLLHDVVLTLENKQFNDIVLQVGMGWGKSLAEDNIRCGCVSDPHS